MAPDHLVHCSALTDGSVRISCVSATKLTVLYQDVKESSLVLSYIEVRWCALFSW